MLGTLRAWALLAAMAMGAILSGCASVPMGDTRQDAQLKTFPAPKPGTAGVYVYRNEVFGGAIRIPLVLDGASLGQSGPKTYFYAELPPGRHTLVSQAENSDTLEFEAVAGRQHFIWQQIQMGLFQPRTKLQLVSADAGRKGVQESALAASNLPAARTPAAPQPAPAATNAPAAAAAPAPGSERYAGTWTGRYRCGPFMGTGQTASPNPFTVNNVQLVVDSGRGTLRRGDATYSEELQGVVTGGGALALTGEGAMVQARHLPWTGRYQGRFLANPERYEATGTLTGKDGQVVRTCTIDLLRGARPD